MASFFRMARFGVLGISLCLLSCVSGPKGLSPEINGPYKHLATPENYPSFEEVSKMPKIAIHCRIYVESYTLFIENNLMGIDLNIFDARSAEGIKADVGLANEVFSRAGIEIQVESIQYLPPIDRPIKEYNDLTAYRDTVSMLSASDTLSIFYIFGHGGVPSFGGSSVFPWEEGHHLFIVGQLADRYTLAHEIGHHFGLLHTFDPRGDFVDDTLVQSFSVYMPDGPTPNKDNVMNYSFEICQTLTDGQLRRARYFIEDHLYPEILTPDPLYNIGDVIAQAQKARIQENTEKISRMNDRPVILHDGI